MPITAPSPAPVIDESLASSNSNPAASVPHTSVTDDDGWQVDSASAVRVEPEELKKRAETVKVDDQVGRRDVRPGAKDSLSPDPKNDPGKKKVAAPPAKKEEPPAGEEQPRGEDGKFAKKDGEQPPTGEEGDGEEEPPTRVSDPAKRQPGESRHAFRIRTRQAEQDDRTAELRRIEDQIAARKKELEDLAAGKDPADKRTPPADALPAAKDDPKPTWKAFQEEGKTWDEYTEAKDAWSDRDHERTKRDLVESVRRDVGRHATVQQKAVQFQDAVKAARAAHEDYDVVVSELSMDNTPFIASMVANSPQGAELLYYLGQNAEIAYDLAELTPPVTLPSGRVGVSPSHAVILEAVVTSPDPAKLLAKLLDPASDHFERISGLSGARAYREITALEKEGDPAPVSDPGRSRTVPTKKPAAPPLRPPQGAAAAGGESRAADDGASDPFSPTWIQQENAKERARGRRY